MRIGIDARMFHKAGIRRYATELIEHLSRLDHLNEYFVYLSSKESLYEFKHINTNFNLIYLEAQLFSTREQLFLITYLKKNNLDVLHTTFDFGAPLWPMSNIVVTVHDAFFGPNTFFRNFKTRLIYQLLTRYSIRRASRILVISQYLKDKVLTLFPNSYRLADKIRVIPNGVGSEFYPLSKPDAFEQIRDKYHIHNKYLLCVGSFASGTKNLYRILSAFSTLPSQLKENYQLVIAGEVLERVPETSTMIKELKTNDRILCLGFVPNEDLPELYRNAEVFIFPSLHEGFGIPILEAMACGIPVVTSNTTAMPEVAGEAAMLVDPYNIDEMREVIKQVITDSHLRNELSKKGVERAKEFSWSVTAKETLNVYMDMNKKPLRIDDKLELL